MSSGNPSPPSLDEMMAARHIHAATYHGSRTLDVHELDECQAREWFLESARDLLAQLEASRWEMPEKIAALQQIALLPTDDAAHMRDIAMRALNWRPLVLPPPTTTREGEG